MQAEFAGERRAPAGDPPVYTDRRAGRKAMAFADARGFAIGDQVLDFFYQNS
jgi:hypothetical protein